MKSGIFARGGRRADEEGGCRIRNPTQRTKTHGGHGEATNFRGEATNFHGEASGGNQWPLHKWIDNRNEVKTHNACRVGIG